MATVSNTLLITLVFIFSIYQINAWCTTDSQCPGSNCFCSFMNSVTSGTCVCRSKLANDDVTFDTNCNTTTTSSTSPPIPSVSPTPKPVYSWEHYSDKYQNKYQGKGNPGSVPGNEVGGGNSEANKDQNAIFCKCLEKEKKSGKGYAESQNAYSKCIDEANGNDAKHWEKVSQRYKNKFGGHSTTANTAGGKDNDGKSILMEVGNDNESNGNAEFITIIGSGVLIFILAWFIKSSCKKWRTKGYDKIGDGQCVVVESDSTRQCNEDGSKFAGWNQYSSV